MKGKWRRILALTIQSAILLSAAGCAASADPEEYDFTVDLDAHARESVSSEVSVHDPSILQVDGTYYIYGSHMTAAKCSDLLSWTWVAEGYSPQNPVYGQIFSVPEEAFAYAGDKISVIPTDDGGTHVWAPDVIYNKTNGLYYMYYCTSSTWNASNLCYGVSASPEGPFEWKGALIYSGFSASNLDQTNVLDYVSEEYAAEHYLRAMQYNYKKCPNALDPTVFYDEDERLWMVYGSWSGGIFLLELDPQTGECIHPEADPEHNVDPYFGKRLLGGGHRSIEGPYILYDEVSGYYYLFVSYGSLVANGGYQIRVFRSETVDGEYVDMNGETLLDNAGQAIYGLKLSGNYRLPSLPEAYMATGHNSVFRDADGKLYVVYHTRFENSGEYHSPRVHQFLVNQEGWPCMLPYQTQGETVSEKGYKTSEVIGRYYLINQGTGIDSEIAEPIIVYLQKDGKVVGEGVQGSWEMTAKTCYLSLTLDECVYSGVFCAMEDEAGNEVMTFSAVGNNESIWGVKYDK